MEGGGEIHKSGSLPVFCESYTLFALKYLFWQQQLLEGISALYSAICTPGFGLELNRSFDVLLV